MGETKGFLYQEIAETLRWRIISGELRPGDKLPPVRELAKQWNCTPGTINRAYGILSQEGLVTAHRGSGTRVTSNAPHGEGSARQWAARQGAAWQWAALINKAEQFLLEAITGGHTPAQAEAALSVAVARWRELQAQKMPDLQSRSARTVLRFAGSHDLAIESLAHLLAEHIPDVALTMTFVGSLGGLMALARDEADVAGSHLWDAATDTYNATFVQRILPGREVVLFSLAYRSLGLVVPAQNPQGIEGVTDLIRPAVVFVNRQPGSGTRVWLDTQLKSLAIEPAAIRGYDRVEATHMGVGQAVAHGQATVGLAIQAAAAAYGLDFIPLARERYDLVMPVTVWETPAVQALAAFIRSPRFHETLQALGGYEPAEDEAEVYHRRPATRPDPGS